MTEAREFGWDFSFYGAVNDGAEKDKLKSEVLSIGFRETERKMFDFTGGDMNKLLKSLLSSMGSGKKVECSEPGFGCLPECKEFKKCTVMHNAASDISENWLNRAFLGQNQALFGPENNPNIENKHFSRHVILNFICTDRLKQISAI